MSRKHFSWLLFATFLVGAVVMILPQHTGKDEVPESGLLLPGLEDKVNEVNWLRLTGAGNQTIVTLQRENDLWTVEETSGYRADWESLRNLLSGLAQARIVEPKTANPEYYERLGVEGVSSESAAGVRVEFAADTGLPAVIVGNKARGRSGQYVRLADSDASALIDTALDVPVERSSWLDQSIIDISEAEVVDVEITHADGELIEATRVSAEDEDFQLQNLPDGRTVKSNWTVNGLANVLADLSMDEVKPQDSLVWEDAARLSLLTADGLQVAVQLIQQAARQESSTPEFWIRLEAGLFTTALGTPAGSEEANEETRKRAEEINNRTRGWAYRIPQYKYKAMTPKMEDLLEVNDEPPSL
ncbi:DUF4340 domain-containing protein [Pseudomonadota bacterium]